MKTKLFITAAAVFSIYSISAQASYYIDEETSYNNFWGVRNSPAKRSGGMTTPTERTSEPKPIPFQGPKAKGFTAFISSEREQATALTSGHDQNK